MKNKKLLCLLLLLVFAFVTGCTPQAAVTDKGKRVVEDLAGREVTIPETVTRVATLEVLGYEKLFLLGESDKIATMLFTTPPWMAETNPAVENIPKVSGEVSAEDVLRKKVDVVFMRYDPKQLARMAELGIPALVSQPVGNKSANAAAYVEAVKQGVRLYGQVMGPEAVRRAEEWCAYYDEKIRFVTSRIASIPAGQRLKAYYVRGPEALRTQGFNTSTFSFGELAGANMVAKESGIDGQGLVSMEDVVRWNPDVIFVGRQYSTSLVTDDPRWQNIAAVKNHRVYVVPEGVFYWDGSTEGVLLMEYMAKVLYPDQFADIDMRREIKEYYAKFYRYSLTDDQADKILKGLSPDGSRANPFNN